MLLYQMILRSPGVDARLSFMLGGSVQFPPKFCRPFEYLVVSLFKLHCIQLSSAARAVNILKFKSPFRPYTIPLSKKGKSALSGESALQRPPPPTQRRSHTSALLQTEHFQTAVICAEFFPWRIYYRKGGVILHFVLT